jgi:methanethiol S-methyltransferase
MRSNCLELALLWSAYCAVHSWLISISAAKFFQRALGTGYRFFRLFYNIFSLITLVLLVLYSNSPRFQGSNLFAWSGNWQYIRYALAFVAIGFMISGARHYSMSQFLGLRQIRNKLTPGALTESGDIDTTGILSVVRHPWYVAVFILIWASNQTVGTVIINVVLSAYLVIGTLLEESKLVLEFGDRYREYQKNVSMFIPYKWLKKLLRTQDSGCSDRRE